MCGRFTHAAFKRRAIQGWGYDWAWKGNFTWGEDWTLKWIAPHCPTTDDFYYLLLSPNFICYCGERVTVFWNQKELRI